MDFYKERKLFLFLYSKSTVYKNRLGGVRSLQCSSQPFTKNAWEGCTFYSPGPIKRHFPRRVSDLRVSRHWGALLVALHQALGVVPCLLLCIPPPSPSPHLRHSGSPCDLHAIIEVASDCLWATAQLTGIFIRRRTGARPFCNELSLFLTLMAIHTSCSWLPPSQKRKLTVSPRL